MSDAMIYVGNSADTIKAAADAIVRVMQAAGTEAAAIAAVHCLSELAKAPHSTTIQNCTFTSNPQPGLTKKRKIRP